MLEPEYLCRFVTLVSEGPRSQICHMSGGLYSGLIDSAWLVVVLPGSYPAQRCLLSHHVLEPRSKPGHPQNIQ